MIEISVDRKDSRVKTQFKKLRKVYPTILTAICMAYGRGKLIQFIQKKQVSEL